MLGEKGSSGVYCVVMLVEDCAGDMGLPKRTLQKGRVRGI